ncbi:DUF3784 domain-containing protein [Merismopedia glauca]|uniref:DUF3137 domain-containing protein n=1 Tax=Merismopedia glauca CCAP 1448/3 TaxID=1296344 RepID=A0A2T1C743_9CYAN|nr:DUF3784 domain-containing protein [Merismopedia glauca]PSB04105.1 hypothetical protein C7B64_05575 [Merismopedia glauca CCAP 1448/3]
MTINLDLFRQHLIYETNTSAEMICQDIKEIANLDRESELQKQKYNRYAKYFGIAIGVCFLLFLVSGIFDFIPLAGIFMIAGFISIIGLIWALIQASKHGKFDLANYRHQVASEIVKMVSRDMPLDATISVRLVLSLPTQKNKLVETIPHPYQSGFKIDTFQDEWLKIRGTFTDNTDFYLTATETSQTKYGWKRSRSGKSKYKSKTKSKGTDLDLTMHYPVKKYGAIQALRGDVVNAFKLPEKVVLKKLKQGEKNLNAIAHIPSEIANDKFSIYQAVTMMFLSTYQVLNLAKVLSKK